MELGVQKILWQQKLRIGDQVFDVLIPVPTQPDACLANIGIAQFTTEADAVWDEDFLRILRTLLSEEDSTVEVHTESVLPWPMQYFPTWLQSLLYTQKTATESISFADIPLCLAYADQGKIHLCSHAKEIWLTHGHKIFWTTGFTDAELEQVPYALEKIYNEKLATLF